MLIQRVLSVIVSTALLWSQTDEQIAKSQKAKQLMASGDYAGAVPLYRELVQALPGDPGLLLNLGMAQHLAGDDRKATAHLKAALKIQPEMFPALAMLGAAHMRLGEPASATAPLRKALAIQPQDTGVRRMLADALLALRRPDEAVSQFAKLAEMEPGNPHAWHGLGRAYEALALRSFDQLERTASGSAWWLALIAESRIRHRQNGAAFYFYRQALEKNPGMRGLRTAVAGIYRDTGRADWARLEEEKEHALGPPDCRAVPVECHVLAGQFGKAVEAAAGQNTAEAQYWRIRAYNGLATEAFNRLASLGPSVPLHVFQAQQHSSQGRHADAVAELKKGMALQPNDARLQHDLAAAMYASGDFAAAEALVRKLLHNRPDDANLQFLLGDSLLHMQRTEEAIPPLKQAVRLNPKLLPARSALGRSLLQSGQAGSAIPHLQAALAIDEDGSLHYQLMRALQATGKPQLAASVLRKYQDMQHATESAKKELEQQAQITAPEPR
jgi:tetratricopeptide (TPR) repeat protein